MTEHFKVSTTEYHIIFTYVLDYLGYQGCILIDGAVQVCCKIALFIEFFFSNFYCSDQNVGSTPTRLRAIRRRLVWDGQVHFQETHVQ
jgi:hypothetical protein